MLRGCWREYKRQEQTFPIRAYRRSILLLSNNATPFTAFSRKEFVIMARSAD